MILREREREKVIKGERDREGGQGEKNASE